LREREMLWWLLLSLHNILYLHEVVSDLRDNIIKWS
jgi:queuine/archaeosine tRNA-ribosyltransferase